MQAVLLNTMVMYVAKAGVVSDAQLEKGTWIARTEGNAIQISQGGVKPGNYDGAAGFLLDSHPIPIVCETGTVNLLNNGGTDIKVYFAKVKDA